MLIGDPTLKRSKVSLKAMMKVLQKEGGGILVEFKIPKTYLYLLKEPKTTPLPLRREPTPSIFALTGTLIAKRMKLSIWCKTCSKSESSNPLLAHSLAP